MYHIAANLFWGFLIISGAKFAADMYHDMRDRKRRLAQPEKKPRYAKINGVWQREV